MKFSFHNGTFHLSIGERDEKTVIWRVGERELSLHREWFTPPLKMRQFTVGDVTVRVAEQGDCLHVVGDGWWVMAFTSAVDGEPVITGSIPTRIPAEVAP